MKKRRLGKTDIQVAPIAFGGNVFGWTLDERASFEILDAFIGAGFNFIDTADTYSRWAPGNQGGESETIIGNWMTRRKNRNKVVIATKVGGDMGHGKKGDLSPKHILSSVENSLKRLQTDYIDLYQSHYDDADTAMEDTLEVYSRLVDQGKVRIIGASNLSAERLEKSLEISTQYGFPTYQTLQPLYNLYDREVFEKELEPLCTAHNIGVLPYYSLASGFLTGKYRSEADLEKSVRGAGNRKYLNDRGFAILHALDQVAEEYNATPASIALAWLLARPSVTAPIASATTIAQLNSLIQATEIKLDAERVNVLMR